MGLLAYLALIAQLFSPQTAHAIHPSNGTPVLASELILLGSGIRANRSSDYIVLACTDATCEKLRFVTIHQGKEAYFFGKTYDGISEKIKKEDLDKRAQSIANEALTLRKSNHMDEERGFGFMAVTGFGTLAMISISVVPFFSLLGGWLILELARGPESSSVYQKMDFLGHIRNLKKSDKKMMGTFKATKVFHDQDGWNWTETPRNVSRNKFCKVFVAINYPHLMNSDSYKYDRSDYRKYERSDYKDNCVEIMRYYN